MGGAGENYTKVSKPYYIRTPTLKLFMEVVRYFKLDLWESSWEINGNKTCVWYQNIRHGDYKGQVGSVIGYDDVGVDFKALLWKEFNKNK
jgi:hypothetical protein